MITSNLVVEGVPGNPHHQQQQHYHHPLHHHALAAANGHPGIHSFGTIHHISPVAVAVPSAAPHLMSATTFADNSFLKAPPNGSLLPTNEFVRPLPKLSRPAPIVAARYNGVTNNLNGSAKSRHSGKYAVDGASGEVSGPVNLVHQLKEPSSSPDSAHATSGGSGGGGGYAGMYSSSRLYAAGPASYPHFPPPPPPPPTIQSGPYGPLYPPNPFTPMLQRDTRSTHLLQLQQYPDSNTPILKSSPTPTTPSSAAAVVTSVAPAKNVVFETPPPPPPARSPSTAAVAASPSETQNNRAEKRPFKVPSGKEGSLKHRLLSRPESTRLPKKVSTVRISGTSAASTTLLPPPPVPAVSSASSSPYSNGVALGVTSPTECTPSQPHSQHQPPSPATPTTVSVGSVSSSSGNNGTVSNNFSRGSLIQLANGDLKKVEDMQMEDFLSSAEKSSTMRIDPSTVVRICESASSKGPFVTLTLSYGEQRHQVDYETPVEHPYFVFQHGWSSCAPEKTFKKFGLRCRQLQVGDVCVSLSRRLGQQSGSQTPRKSGALKSESAASKLRHHQGVGHDEHASQAALRNDHHHHHQQQPSNGGVCVDAANGVAGGGGVVDSNATTLTLSYKKNDLKNDNCNENNGLRFNHTNGDIIDSNCSSSSSSSSSSSCNGSTSNPHANSIVNGGMNFTLNLTNRHGPAAADEEKRNCEKLENDTNNNSNNMSDKYGGLPNKKKRRWSAPDQISDEYQSSPLSSPQSVLSSASSAGSDGRNI